MPGRQPEDWGIPLWEAIERWTPRELWERYREIAEYDIPLIILGAEDPRSDEVRRLRSRITEVLVNRLARGEFDRLGSRTATQGDFAASQRQIRVVAPPCLQLGVPRSGRQRSPIRRDLYPEGLAGRR